MLNFKSPLILTFVLAATFSCGGDDEGGTGGGSGAGDGSGGNAGGDGGGTLATRVENYARGTEFTKLVLEIDAVSSLRPNSGAQSSVLSQLEGLIDKPDGIEAVLDEELSAEGEDKAWSNEELFQLADDTFSLSVDETTIKMHVLFVDGHSDADSESGKILGIAWANKNIVIFKETILSLCGGRSVPALIRDQLCESAEASIWTHEAGHVLGLVNAGITPTSDHQDEEHGAHDINDECVMFWAYEGEALIGTLQERILAGNTEALKFDAACVADVESVKAP